jgi:hypothetical protein
MLMEKKPKDCRSKMRTQAPSSWSQVLQPYEMKLAYCPIDVHQLKFYMKEVVAVDGIFILNYYTSYLAITFELVKNQRTYTEPSVFFSSNIRSCDYSFPVSLIMHFHVVFDSLNKIAVER